MSDTGDHPAPRLSFLRRIRPVWWFRIVFALLMIAFMSALVVSRVAHERGHELERSLGDAVVPSAPSICRAAVVQRMTT